MCLGTNQFISHMEILDFTGQLSVQWQVGAQSSEVQIYSLPLYQLGIHKHVPMRQNNLLHINVTTERSKTGTTHLAE